MGTCAGSRSAGSSPTAVKTLSASARRCSRDSSGRCSLRNLVHAVRHAEGGVQRAVRVLEHHRDLAAVREEVPSRAQGGQRPTLEQDRRRRWADTPWASSRAMVLLPLPLSPTRATISRSPMVMSTSSSGVQELTREDAAQAEMLGELAGLQQRGLRPAAAATVSGMRLLPGLRDICVEQAAHPFVGDVVQVRFHRRGTPASPPGSADGSGTPPGGAPGRAGCPGCR